MYAPSKNCNMQNMQNMPSFSNAQNVVSNFSNMANMGQFNTMAINADQYGDRCGVKPPPGTVRVPTVNHIVHRFPVVYETVSQETSFYEVPIVHSYEQRDYPQQIAAECPVQAAPVCNAPVDPCGNGNMAATVPSYPQPRYAMRAQGGGCGC
jgi:hypothetical protein